MTGALPLLALLLQGLSITATAAVDRDRVAVGDEFTYTIYAKADGPGSLTLITPAFDGLEVVVAKLGAQHEVTGSGADRLWLALDVPVDLTLHDHPPLVVLVVVRIVRRAWRVQDDERLDVVGQHQRPTPRAILGRVAGQEVVEVRV